MANIKCFCINIMVFNNFYYLFLQISFIVLFISPIDLNMLKKRENNF